MGTGSLGSGWGARTSVRGDQELKRHLSYIGKSFEVLGKTGEGLGDSRREWVVGKWLGCVYVSLG